MKHIILRNNVVRRTRRIMGTEVNSMEVYIDSKELLKPSSPTPPHLSTFKFSLLEQISEINYIQVIFFYNLSDGHQISQHLKQSLSKTLIHFPPLAGRLKDNASVNCNDEGILYVEARADGAMTDFLEDIDVEKLERFLPIKKAPKGRLTEIVQAAIQVTLFQQGGIAIGGCFGHKVFDAISVGCFMWKWTGIFNPKGHVEVEIPFDFTTASSIFPPLDKFSFLPEYFEPDVKDGTCIVKRFVFNPSAIKTLIAKAASELVPRPTRVQVISAFVWKHALRAFGKVNSILDDGERKVSHLAHPINVRKPSLSPLSLNNIGSLILPSIATCDWDQREDDIGGYVGRVYQAISKVDKEYVNKFRKEEEAIGAIAEITQKLTSEDRVVYICSSCTKLGADVLDFGWGNPAWVSAWAESPTRAENHHIVLMDSGGDTIEAALVLDKSEMSSLLSDQEFLEFAIPATGIFA
ncbi:hypothetical protein Drorol1_Dr00002623 [Drosera rotundifolia]